MLNEKKPSSNLRNNAKEVKAARKYKKILPPVIGLIVSLLVIVYVISLLSAKFGSFTISVKDYADKGYALTLSENDSFIRSSSKLTAQEVKNADNITYSNLPDNLNDVNGSHNGENYLAYTFYLKNTGEKECNYRYSLNISQATVGIDAAVRIRIYFNPDYYKSETGEYTHSGEYTDYAKPKTGGNGMPEIDPINRVMTNFLSSDVVAEKTINAFKPNDIAKITVVIWIEGEDPDCTDDVLGGSFKTEMNFEIVGTSE